MNSVNVWRLPRTKKFELSEVNTLWIECKICRPKFSSFVYKRNKLEWLVFEIYHAEVQKNIIASSCTILSLLNYVPYLPYVPMCQSFIRASVPTKLWHVGT